MASSSKPSGSKRKLTDTCTCSTSEVKVARISRNPPSSSYLQKKHCCCLMPIQPTLAESCLSYLTTKTPARIMFYSQNQWCTFSEPALRVLINGFKEDKSSTIVFSDGQSILVDFLSMTSVNLNTKKHRSIAWIDETGKCFFPPIFIDQESSKELHGTSTGRADIFVERALLEPQSSGPSIADVLRKKILPVERGTATFLSVQNLFLGGMGPFASLDIIQHIYCYQPEGSDVVAHSRLVEFERRLSVGLAGKGVSMTSGWIGFGKREMARVLIHGFNKAVKPNEGTFGTDFFVMPQDRSFACVNHCDVDEKGMQCMLLCRVIGSLPKTGNGFKPKYYVVPSVDANSCLYPEYVVTFKLSPVVREYLMGLNGRHLSEQRVTTFVRDLSTLHPLMNNEAGPRSPWISFTGLFAEIQDRLCPIARELLALHYDELKKNIIIREELVRRIRIIVGDELVRSTLTKVRNPSVGNDNPFANMNQRDIMAAASELIAGPPISVVCDSVPVDTSLSVGIGTNRDSQSKGASIIPPKHAIHDSERPETSDHGTDDESGRKMRYLSIEQGMKLNNATIDSMLRAAKLEPAP